jgi:hypothetical protein
MIFPPIREDAGADALEWANDQAIPLLKKLRAFATGEAITRVNLKVSAVTGAYAWDSAMKYVEVTGTGAGGGGGGADTTGAAGTVGVGAGGGSGATTRRIYSRAAIEALNGGNPVPYTIGAAGAGGSNTGGRG